MSLAWPPQELERCGAEVFAAAALCGDPALLARLRALGCACEAGAWVAAADAGCGPALTWLAEAGCPRPVSQCP